MNKKFSKILIANRGEIALRIIRAAREMNIATVAVYSDEEKNALHVQQADEAYSLGSGTLSDTYLNIEKIIFFARQSNVDAIHPGYGFLSENSDFAKACLKNGITFVGPDVDVLKRTGDKTSAKIIAQNAGVRVLETIDVNAHNFKFTDVFDFRLPLMIKAAHGGGGKGMQLVYSKDELAKKVTLASRLAEQYFGNGEIFIEEYIENARHIEVQILADNYGNILHLYERDCTIQRKYQKIIEEAPATCISNKTCTAIHQAALAICCEVGFVNVGTVEFLVNCDEEFFFLEINPRIQVEHRVSELITGIDIVQWQLKIAAGNKLDIHQEDIVADGHAIEARLYAENTSSDFVPSGTPVKSYHFPERNASVEHALSIDELIGQFDPLLAKVIVWDTEREKAVQLMKRALADSAVFGPTSNLAYLQVIFNQSDFNENLLTTSYCNDKHASLLREMDVQSSEVMHEQLTAAAVILFFTVEQSSFSSPFNMNWRIVRNVELEIEGQVFDVVLTSVPKGLKVECKSGVIIIDNYRIENDVVVFEIGDRVFSFFYHKENNARIQLAHMGNVYKIALPCYLDYYEDEDKENVEVAGFSNVINSPLHGKIVSINIKQGQTIKKGDVLLTIESMKSENVIRSAVDASVKSVAIQVGEQVSDRSPLVYLEEC